MFTSIHIPNVKIMDFLGWLVPRYETAAMQPSCSTSWVHRVKTPCGKASNFHLPSPRPVCNLFICSPAPMKKYTWFIDEDFFGSQAKSCGQSSSASHRVWNKPQASRWLPLFRARLPGRFLVDSSRARHDSGHIELFFFSPKTILQWGLWVWRLKWSHFITLTKWHQQINTCNRNLQTHTSPP